LQSDEPETGPPAPAPVLEKPIDARPGGSAVAAPALPVAPIPAVSEPARVPAPAGLAESGGAERARPLERSRSGARAAAERARPDSADRARSGDRLRAVRSGEASGAPERAQAVVPPPASFGVRLLAGLADALLLGAGQALVLAPVVYYWSGRPLPATPTAVPLLPIVLSLTLLPLAGVLGVAYYIYGWGVRGATPGQGFFELSVESEDGRRPIGLGRAGLRFLGYLLSLASLGVGFLMIAFTGSGLHDRIAGTRVVRGRSA
ncbi:MAG TPA: RDD family protein, partial [Vicinamibacteria bacterium]